MNFDQALANCAPGYLPRMLLSSFVEGRIEDGLAANLADALKQAGAAVLGGYFTITFRDDGAPCLAVTQKFAEVNPPADRKCRVCGCHLFAPCWDDESGPCYWVERDLCSACAAAAADVTASTEGSAASDESQAMANEAIPDKEDGPEWLWGRASCGEGDAPVCSRCSSAVAPSSMSAHESTCWSNADEPGVVPPSPLRPPTF